MVALNLQIPLEVELPSVNRRWLSTFLIEERNTKLDYFHFIDRSLDGAVLTLLFWTIFKVKFKEPREFSVLNKNR